MYRRFRGACCFHRHLLLDRSFKWEEWSVSWTILSSYKCLKVIHLFVLICRLREHGWYLLGPEADISTFLTSKCKWILRWNPELTSTLVAACHVESFEIRSTKGNVSSVCVVLTVVVPNLNLWFRNFKRVPHSAFKTRPSECCKKTAWCFKSFIWPFLCQWQIYLLISYDVSDLEIVLRGWNWNCNYVLGGMVTGSRRGLI